MYIHRIEKFESFSELLVTLDSKNVFSSSKSVDNGYGSLSSISSSCKIGVLTVLKHFLGNFDRFVLSILPSVSFRFMIYPYSSLTIVDGVGDRGGGASNFLGGSGCSLKSKSKLGAIPVLFSICSDKSFNNLKPGVSGISRLWGFSVTRFDYNGA